MTSLVRRAAHKSWREFEVVARRVRLELSRRQLGRLPDGVRFHLGCGTNHFPGWTEVDIDRSTRPHVVHDLRLGLPARPGSARLIYSEHVFEHLELEHGELLM